MQEKSHVSEEEMKALFPYQEVSKTHLESIRPKILKRCVLIVLLWGFRAIMVTQFPEYHLASDFNERLLDTASVENMVNIRLSMVFLGSAVYLYSCYRNLYFRSVNVAALIIVCCLIWGDMELYLLSAMGDLSKPSLAMVAFRLIPLSLLIMNYRDIRQ
jgi:ABC-type spermidine/putrescine transport system permease subunit I